MANRSIPHSRVPMQDIGDAETACAAVQDAQAAAWMLRELAARNEFSDETFVNRASAQTPEALRDALTAMALDRLWEKLGEARRALDALAQARKAVA